MDAGNRRISGGDEWDRDGLPVPDPLADYHSSPVPSSNPFSDFSPPAPPFEESPPRRLTPASSSEKKRLRQGIGGKFTKQLLIGVGVLSLAILAVAALLSVLNNRSNSDPQAIDEVAADVQPTQAVVSAGQPSDVSEQPSVVSAGQPPEPVSSPPAPVPPEPSSGTQLVPESTVIAPEPDSSDPIVSVATRVLPAVVTIETLDGQGSGIIYDKQGYIYTAAHVIAGADEVVVRLHSGFKVEGDVLGTNEEYDVAVVRIETDQEFGVAEFASLETVEVGQVAVAVGSPFGLDNGITEGIVSALRVPERNSVNPLPPVKMIQTNSQINSGDSGGALADSEGRVVGMNVAIVSTSAGGNIGLGFATPIEVVEQIAGLILTGQTLQPGYLGITGATPRLGHPGAEVVSIIEGAPSDLAGMRAGDLIRSVDGEEVKSIEDLVAILRLRQVGAKVVVVVERDDESFQFTVELTSRDLFEEE